MAKYNTNVQNNYFPNGGNIATLTIPRIFKAIHTNLLMYRHKKLDRFVNKQESLYQCIG